MAGRPQMTVSMVTLGTMAVPVQETMGGVVHTARLEAAPRQIRLSDFGNNGLHRVANVKHLMIAAGLPRLRHSACTHHPRLATAAGMPVVDKTKTLIV